MAGQSEKLPTNYALLRDIVHAAGRGAHHTAADIYRLARGLQPTIGLATVHRGLARLCEEGTICRIGVPHADAAWYEAPAPAHAHLLCTACGSLCDVEYATASEVLAGVAAREGVRIAEETITFHGLCARCADSHVTTVEHPPRR
jgi:Fur family ferric uptake transcriptional regulator